MPANKKLQKASFGMGCFWQPEYDFSKLPGVVSTRVGYAGGHTDNPNYKDLADHTETVEVTYDPNKVSYKELLKNFWQHHNPTENQSSQYRSLIFVHDDEQRQAAMETMSQKQKELGRLTTEVLPAGDFHQAEDYHQKYVAKQKGEA